MKKTPLIEKVFKPLNPTRRNFIKAPIELTIKESKISCEEQVELEELAFNIFREYISSYETPSDFEKFWELNYKDSLRLPNKQEEVVFTIVSLMVSNLKRLIFSGVSK